MSDIEIHKITITISSHTPEGEVLRKSSASGRLGIGADPEAIAFFASNRVLNELFPTHFPEGVR